MIDTKWFKLQQKRAGVTAEDIAKAAGRTRTAVSNIYTGRQRMSLDWAKIFAEVLDVPLEEVLTRGGAAEPYVARQLSPGFSEGDAEPFVSKGAHDAVGQARVAAAFGARAGVDPWLVRSPSMALQGLLPGDMLLVDSHAPETVRSGDIVIAQVYDNARGTASMVLRRFEPPVLVAASTDASDRRVLVLDGVNVVVRGKVIASWRVA